MLFNQFPVDHMVANIHRLAKQTNAKGGGIR